MIHETLSILYKITKKIYQHVKQADEINAKRQKQLNQILAILDILDLLKDHPNQTNFTSLLNDLVMELEQLQRFLDNLASDKTKDKILNIFKSEANAKTLEAYTESIHKKIQILAMAIGAKHLVEAEKHFEDIENKLDKSFAAMNEFIKNANKEVLSKLDGVSKKQESSLLMLQQMNEMLQEIKDKQVGKGAYKQLIEQKALDNNDNMSIDPREALKQAIQLDREAKQEPKKYRSAFLLYKFAAKEGEKKAFGRLGYFYAQGRGTDVKTNKALFWLEKAASFDLNAKSNLEILRSKINQTI